jgi:hypothetical protein
MIWTLDIYFILILQTSSASLLVFQFQILIKVRSMVSFAPNKNDSLDCKFIYFRKLL